MRRNQINVPLPTGWASTQDTMALGGLSWEQNVLLLVTEVGSGQGLTGHASSLEGSFLQVSS